MTPGSSVFAGTRNTGAALMVRVRQVGATTRLGRLIELLRLNAKDRATIIEVTDRLGGWFVIAVLGLAGASFYYWSSVSLEKAVAVTVSLLVISCPCALGLSAPVCLSVAVARAARHGILIRGKDVIERITRVKRIFFDKTGTVTSGTPSVVVCEPPLSVQAKRAIAQLERDSEHPYARALRYYVDSTAAGQAEFSVESYPGKGVQGTDSSGDEWQIGSVSWLTDQILDSPIDWRTHVAELKSRCLSPIIVCRNAEVVAVIGVGDDLKTGIDHVIHELESSGREVHLLSGDDPQITSVVAHALKIPCERAIGGASPEEKIAIVAESSRVTPTLMIGDGVNDAAALHAATVGVGVRGGAENCLVAADVFLQEPDAEQIAQLFSGAQRTMAIVHRNLLLSLIYNVVGAGAAICGVVDPLFAALLMPLSSVTVVVSSVFSKSY